MQDKSLEVPRQLQRINMLLREEIEFLREELALERATRRVALMRLRHQRDRNFRKYARELEDLQSAQDPSCANTELP